VAKRSVDRLSAKLEKLRGTGRTIEMGEEFRILTLQVIGELVLSLSPEESEAIFPALYLPIVIEVRVDPNSLDVYDSIQPRRNCEQ
jgi:hypothetical protein